MYCGDLVSVIVPVYNVGDYLRGCLDSIHQQTYKNFEVLVIDDGSTDGSASICDEFMRDDSRFVVIHKKNGGVSSARNDGLRLAKGKYVIFIDSDDIIDSNYIEAMVDGIELYNVDFVKVRFKRNGVVLDNLIKYDKLDNNVIKFHDLVDLSLFASACGIMMKTKFLENVFFDEKIYYGEDTLFMMQAFLNSDDKSILLLNKTFYHYTYRESSATNTSFNEKWLTLIDVSKRVNQLLANYPSMVYVANSYKKFCYAKVLQGLIESKDIGHNEKKQFLRQEIKSLRKKGLRPEGLLNNIVELSTVYGGYGLLMTLRKIKKSFVCSGR